MKWCESCKTEYEDYAETCSDCGSDLVFYQDNLKQQDYDKAHIELRCIYTADSNMDTELILSLLNSNGIVTEIKRKGSGSYLNIATGINYQGTDIYVSEGDFDEAQNVLEARPTENELVEDDEDIISEQNHKSDRSMESKFLSRRRNSVRVILIVSFVIPILLMIISKVQDLLAKL